MWLSQRDLFYAITLTVHGGCCVQYAAVWDEVAGAHDAWRAGEGSYQSDKLDKSLSFFAKAWQKKNRQVRSGP